MAPTKGECRGRGPENHLHNAFSRAWFYLDCIPAAIAEAAFPEGRWPIWAALLLAWTAFWLLLVGATNG